jgi:alpha-amylase/alpha-mannosidase (GH57 family)
MNRFVCIHGHFYQPPRENAWLDRIELQESAHPFHDWNERIMRECYEPNGFSRILNGGGKIVDIVNNYARMSFNFGPTLLHWIEKEHPKVYNSILDADKLSMELFDGHGSAMAQAYNHIIMPLADRRDKVTQVKWGIADFEYRFGRKPEGMWLGETAANTETLEVLAENGIKFTLLAPNQAHQVRKIGATNWEPFHDTRVPYLCQLPSGKSIALFFYDGDRSQGIAFKGLLGNGQRFAEELISGLDDREGPQLAHVATDGESYGHHHRHGDMALAYCTRYIEHSEHARMTNYSQFLSLCPPEYEVQIHENSSWSCAHGVERWRSNCGCHTGGQSGWTQEWRAPLREALDWLRDRSNEVYFEETSAFPVDADELRNSYIQVILHRSRDHKREWLKSAIPERLSKREMTRLLRCLEMQKHSQFMYTSCGWFFNELSGIETVQILQYANRAIQIIRDLTGENLDEEFALRLSKAKSNIPSQGDGQQIYQKRVMPRQLTLTQVGMHYAVDTLFNTDKASSEVLNYECVSEHLERHRAGIQLLAIGKTVVNSNVTLSRKTFSFAILYLGNHHLIGNTSDSMTDEQFAGICEEIRNAFNSGNLTKTIDLIKLHFTARGFSFYDLFLDYQLDLLNRVLENNIELALTSYEKINDRTYSLLSVMRNNHLGIPPILFQNLETVINFYIEDLLKSERADVSIQDLEERINEVKRWNLRVNQDKLAFLATNRFHTLIERFRLSDADPSLIEQIRRILDVLKEIEVHPAIHELQNFLFETIKAEKEEHKHCNLSLTRLAEHVNLDVHAIRGELITQ